MLARNAHRRPRPVCLALVVPLVLGLAGCSPGPPPDASGVPDALVEDSRQFQRRDGLFVLPEAAARPGVDPGLTAELAESASPGLLSALVRVKTTTVPFPEPADAPSLADYLVLTARAGGAPLTGRREAAARSVALPPLQEELGAEVGALATWAECRGRAPEIAAALDARDGAKARRRADAVDARALRRYPYLLWRLQRIRALLELPADPRLDAAMAASLAGPWPAPAGPESLADALVLAAGHARPDPSTLDSWRTALTAKLSEPSVDVDVVRATALAERLQLADLVERGVKRIRAAQDPQTGLLRSDGAPQPWTPPTWWVGSWTTGSRRSPPT